MFVCKIARQRYAFSLDNLVFNNLKSWCNVGCFGCLCWLNLRLTYLLFGMCGGQVGRKTYWASRHDEMPSTFRHEAQYVSLKLG